MNSPFKWRHYQPEIILLCVRWYLKYPLSSRQLEEMMRERGLEINHTTIYRWVQKYARELEKRISPHLKAVGKSWRVDETYVKIKGSWKYLYRAIDSDRNTIDFMLSARRNLSAAYRFFKKILKKQDSPQVINTDKNPAYPLAVKQLKSETLIQQTTILRRDKYLSAPQGAYIARYQARGQKHRYWYYQLKAPTAIFAKKNKDREYSRFQHLGKAGTQAHIDGVLAVVRRVQINELTQTIEGLKQSWLDFYFSHFIKFWRCLINYIYK